MIYIDLLGPKLTAEACEEIDNHNGTFSYKKQNEKILCYTPTGEFEERDSPGGAWESFKRSDNALVAERELNGKSIVYLLPFVEVS